MLVMVSQAVTLDNATVERVAKSYLSSLKKEQWVEEKDGKLILMEEVATSHRFDMEVKYQDPVRIKIIKAVQDFEKALKEYEASFGKDGRK